ncbi:hypothetical protein J3458_015554 [Metarhizium acridum]|uniref:uncharacterized protein n=1 Tax=Metarhizium acridum TaxID=92637 RepID=UPI001C6C55C7|nr:hypothetical protein J3458_015554 [Metarhizium acridum]
MATFHRFPRVPYEIRATIWRLTAVRREVQIKAKDKPRTVTDPQRPDDEDHREIAYLYSPTPVPAVLHTCRESP